MALVDWGALRREVFDVFTPGPPINEYDLFVGRHAVIQRLQDIVIEQGRHAIIFGERGRHPLFCFPLSIQRERRRRDAAVKGVQFQTETISNCSIGTRAFCGRLRGYNLNRTVSARRLIKYKDGAETTFPRSLCQGSPKPR